MKEDKLLEVVNVLNNAIDRLNELVAEPPKRQVRTTVTVWYKAQCPHLFDMALDGINKDNELWHRGYYHFSGTPIVKQVIDDTLGKGAMVIKIESSKKFSLRTLKISGVLLWDTKLGGLGRNDSLYVDYNYRIGVLTDTITIPKLEQAITAYLSDDIKAGDIVHDGMMNLGLVIETDGVIAYVENVEKSCVGTYNIENLRIYNSR